MTMLDRMRRHKNWLKWSLGLVCLAFIIFYIPDFLSTRATGSAPGTGDTIAKVQGQSITAGEYRRTYDAQLQAYRKAYGANMSDQLLRQLGIDQQILQRMVEDRAALVEADRLGIEVNDEEVRQRIMSFPAFLENGAFIGEQRYQQLLRMQRMTASEFEASVRRELIIEKLRASVTDWLTVPEPELEQEYRRRNNKVKLAVVSITADTFRPQVTATDDEVASYFAGHSADFKVPEKRKIKYVLIDIDALRAKVVVPAADVERAYNSNIDQYTTPEQVRASHILFKTEGKDETAVKATAEDVL